MGLTLDKNADLDEQIAGQIQRLEDGTYKISVNKNDHSFRKRFTMAHELGHFIYHKGLIGSGIDDDRLYRSTSVGNFYNDSIKQQHEVEANKFAAAILMPKPKIQQDYDNHKDLNLVAAMWQVSPQALRIRLGLPE
jgi:Zn-dependent peptidase ImmA (M78 family)